MKYKKIIISIVCALIIICSIIAAFFVGRLTVDKPIESAKSPSCGLENFVISVGGGSNFYKRCDADNIKIPIERDELIAYVINDNEVGNYTSGCRIPDVFYGSEWGKISCFNDENGVPYFCDESNTTYNPQDNNRCAIYSLKNDNDNQYMILELENGSLRIFFELNGRMTPIGPYPLGPFPDVPSE